MNWVEPLGWTLIHFLWQGVLVAVVYAAARRGLGDQCSPNARYVLACAALAAMIAAPLLTFDFLNSDATRAEFTGLSQPFDAAPAAAGSGRVESFSGGSVFSRDSVLSWVVALWVIGATAFSVRLAGGWIVASRMRFAPAHWAPSEWRRVFSELAGKVNCSRPVKLLVSARVDAPTVIGWLRPVVLLPIGALTSLPTVQVEALLLHELAHIRRRDYLVNVIQTACEALLFYHPAVWWISSHIRAERELCCDDIVVSVTGDPLSYAQALAELESFRAPHPNLAVAASGGSLEERIRHLLDQKSGSLPRTGVGPMVIVSIAIVVASVFGAFGQSAATPAFGVASITRNTNNGRGVQAPGAVRMLREGRMTAEWIAPETLIREAYGLKPFRVLGAPEWIYSDRYDLEAKGQLGASPDEMRRMLQSFLEDELSLKVHRESRPLSVYTITIADSGIKLSPPQRGGCGLGGSIPPPPPPPGQMRPNTPLCGRVEFSLMSVSHAFLEGGYVTMADLTAALTNIMGRPVIDMTGFTAEFDVHLAFRPDDALAGVPGYGSSREFVFANGGIFAAMETQLGLKLEATTSPVEVLIVDHVERP